MISKNGTSPSSDLYLVENTAFSDNNHGIIVEDAYGIKVSNSTFDGNGGHHQALMAIHTKQVLLHGSTVENYQNYGVWVDDVLHCQIKNTEIKDCDYGVWAQNFSNVFLSHGTALRNNQTAVHLLGDEEDGMVSMDCAILDGNVHGITGTDVLLNINPLIQGFSAPYISPNTFKNIDPNGWLFDICYVKRDISVIDAPHNYWDGMMTLPTYMYRIHYNGGSTNCPSFSNVTLNMANAMPTEPQGCNYENPTATIPGSPSLGNMPLTERVALQCSLTINSQNYDVYQQYKLGDKDFKEDDFDDADLKYAPVSAIDDNTRDNSTTQCQQYIDVSKVMVKVEDLLKSGKSLGIPNS